MAHPSVDVVVDVPAATRSDSTTLCAVVTLRSHSRLSVRAIDLVLLDDDVTLRAFPFSLGPRTLGDLADVPPLTDRVDRAAPDAPTMAGADPCDDRPFDRFRLDLEPGVRVSGWVEFHPGIVGGLARLGRPVCGTAIIDFGLFKVAVPVAFAVEDVEPLDGPVMKAEDLTALFADRRAP
jgi:hypothetical protein